MIHSKSKANHGGSLRPVALSVQKKLDELAANENREKK